jgi:hypothetical protein
MLPTRVTIAPDEALDGFLERLALANSLDAYQFTRMLRDSSVGHWPAPGFLMVKPGSSAVESISGISGIAPEKIRQATLLRFDHGLPLTLTGFDPLNRHSFRQVVTQGWFPPTGSQVCTQCLAAQGIWQLHWRLPLSTTCSTHGTFLTTTCRGCGDWFRVRRYAPLRPLLGREELCGNQIGLRTYCDHPIISHESFSAPTDVVDTGAAIAGAIAGADVKVFTEWTAAPSYLAELRHLATLLLHLATRPRGRAFVDWAEELHREASERATARRGPRWGISPPRSPRVRAMALNSSAQILAEPTLAAGAERLRPWFDLIDDSVGGPSNWLMNRTTRTEGMRRLIDAALADRRCVGRRIDYARGKIKRPLESVPHLVDSNVYCELFGGMLGSYEWTGRLYVSLCMARELVPGRAWAEAAASIGLPRVLGQRTARAVSTRMRVTPATFADAVQSALARLPVDRDFRRRERRVLELASAADDWFTPWRMSIVPARRAGSLPYAIRWMWCEVAQGWPDAGPVRTKSRSREAYCAFRDRLPPDGQQALRSLVVSSS